LLIRVDPAQESLQSVFYQQDNNEMTALHSACMMGATDIVTFLHRKGLDSFAKDAGGWTPFIFALYREQVDCVLVLLGINKQQQADTQQVVSRSISRSTIENAYKHFFYLGKLVNERGNDDSILNDVLESLATVPEFFQIINEVISHYGHELSDSLSYLASMPFLMNTTNKTRHANAIVRQLYGSRLNFPMFISSTVSASVGLSRSDPWAGFLCLFGLGETLPADICKIGFSNESLKESYNGYFEQLDKVVFLLQNRIIFQYHGHLENGTGVGVEREVAWNIYC